MNETRAERARRAAAVIAGRVHAVAPAGLGHWARAWDLVEEPSKRFLDALDAWEQAPDGGPNEKALQVAAVHTSSLMVDAWRLAASEWEAAGKPVTWAPEQQEAVPCLS